MGETPPLLTQPRYQGGAKNRQGPGKNNWTDHVPSELPDKNFGILEHFWLFKKSKKTKWQPINACLHS